MQHDTNLNMQDPNNMFYSFYTPAILNIYIFESYYMEVLSCIPYDTQ